MLNFRKIPTVEQNATNAWAPFGGILDPPGRSKSDPKILKLNTTVAGCQKKVPWEMEPIQPSGQLFM